MTPQLAKSIFSLDDDVDHFAFFILSILRNAAQDPFLAKELRVDPLDCMDHQVLVYRMEYASDFASDIAKHIVMLNGTGHKIPDDVLEPMIIAGTEAAELYLKAVEAFFTKDLYASIEIHEKTAQTRKTGSRNRIQSLHGSTKTRRISMRNLLHTRQHQSHFRKQFQNRRNLCQQSIQNAKPRRLRRT